MCIRDSATLMDKLGGYTRETRTPDSVEGWYWGAKHVWGAGANKGLGLVAPPETGYNSWNVLLDICQNSEMLVFDAGDYELTTNYASMFLSQVMGYWEELGKEMICVDPFCNYTSVCHTMKLSLIHISRWARTRRISPRWELRRDRRGQVDRRAWLPARRARRRTTARRPSCETP